MASITFDCIGAQAEPYAAAPTLNFRLRASETTGTPVHTIALRCQIRIEPARRRYSPAEEQRLYDLFGEPSRWGDTLKPIQFATVTAMVPSFTGAVEFDVPVVCTYDLEIASTRYFYGLEDDTVPLLLLFSGTVFARTGEQGFAVEPVPWSAECGYRLPIQAWQDMVDRYFPNSGWLRLTQETLDELARFKADEALPTWESTITTLLDRVHGT